MMRSSLKIIISLLILILLYAGSAFAQETADENKTKVYIAHSIDQSNKTEKALTEWKGNRNIPPGSYRIKALTSFVQDQSRTIKQINLDVGPKDLKNNSFVKSDESSVYRLFGPGLKPSFDFSFAFPKKNENESLLANSNELRVSYRDLFPENPSEFDLKILVEGNRNGENELIEGYTLGKSNFTSIDSIDISKAVWKRKDISYLLGRESKASFDAIWRYKQDRQFVVVQRRFNRTLQGVEWIDLITDPNTEIKTVNFRVAKNNSFVGNINVISDDFRQEILKTKNKKVTRISTRKMLSGIFDTSDDIVLEEIIIFVVGQETEIAKNKVVKKLMFWELDLGNSKEVVDRVILAPRIESQPNGIKQIAVDLDALKGKGPWNGKLTKIQGEFRAKNPGSIGGVQILSSRVVRLQKNDRPMVAAIGKDKILKLGGPFSIKEKFDGKYEWPQIIASLDFKNFLFDEGSLYLVDKKGKSKVWSVSSTDRFVYRSPAQEILNIFDLDELEYSFISRRGSDSISEKFFDLYSKNQKSFLPELDSKPINLKLKGNGRWLELKWPVQTDVKNNTFLYLDLGTHIGPIESLEVYLPSDINRLAPITGMPNSPIPLKKWEGEQVKALLLRINLPKEMDFDLSFVKLMLFSSVSLSGGEALLEPLESWESGVLKPESIKTSVGRVVNSNQRIEAVVPGDISKASTITWETKVGQKVSQVFGFDIGYKIPRFITQTNPCWLSLTFLTENNRSERSICPKETKGRIFVSMRNLRNIGSLGWEERIDKIIWKINLENPLVHSLIPGIIQIEATQIFLKQSSVLHQLSEKDLITIHNKGFKPNLSAVSPFDLVGGKNWIDFGNLDIGEKLSGNLSLGFPPNKYLRVHTVVLEGNDPFNQFIQNPLARNETQAESNSGRKFFIILIPILALVVTVWVCMKGKQVFDSLLNSKFFGSYANFLKKINLRRFIPGPKIETILYFVLAIIIYLVAYYILSFGLNLRPIGDLLMILVWYKFIQLIRPQMELKLPELAVNIYMRAGGPFILGFAVIMVICAFLSLIRVEIIARMIIEPGYYMLAVGMALEVWSIRFNKESSETPKKSKI